MNHIELNNKMANEFKENLDFDALKYDKQAVKEYLKEVEEKLIRFDSVKERLDYLIHNDYYINVYKDYSLKQVENITSHVYSYNFEFQSYMAVSKFYRDYAMKTNDEKNYMEKYEDRIIIVSLFLGEGNFLKAKNIATSMIEQRYQPATPTMLNAGKTRRGEMVSCFLLEMDDTLNSIMFNINTSAQLSKLGGGVALNLSKLRARNETIKEIENSASGVMPVMKLLEDTFSYADQLGQRKGAGAVYLNIFHADLMEFLSSKKINASEKARIQTLSIGLIIPDKFMELAEKNEDFYVFSPYTVYKEFGVHLDDMKMDEYYDKLVANPNVKKESYNTREVLEEIANIQFQSGYPYIMYKDNANATHTLKDIADVKMSNLCTEIFQMQTTSTINDYGTEDVIRHDISCNLGSTNIVNVMESKKFRETMHDAIDALTTVSDNTSIDNAPSVKKANEDLHSVGLGAMNLHAFLAKNGIMFDSIEARDFVRVYFMMMNFYTLEKSMLIAKERKATFVGFGKSEYAKGEEGNFFPKYLEKDWMPKTDKVKELFEGIEIPDRLEWRWLMEQVLTYGIWHSYRLAIAPTQSISYVQNSTSSVMPVPNVIEERKYENSKTYYPMPYLSPESYFFYQSAYEIDQFKLIDLIADIQVHIDQGISTILYVNSDTSTRELAKLYVYAHKKGLKSLYYTRTNKKSSVEECIACAV